MSRERAAALMRWRFRVGLLATSLATVVLTTVSVAVVPAAANSSPADFTSVSVAEVQPTSVVVNVDFSRGYVPGSCRLTAWADVNSVGTTPSFHKETEHTQSTSGGDRRASYRIDGLVPNARYATHATVLVTGHGFESAPCRDVSKGTTTEQDFTTAKEQIPGGSWSYGHTTNATKAIVELQVTTKPLPHGTSTIHLEFGPTTAYGTASPATPCTTSSCTATYTIQPNPTVVKPNATYHFRGVLQNDFSGRLEGSDDIFYTPNACKLPPTDSGNFTDCDLNGVDWSGKKAEFIVLNGAKMNKAVLAGATIHGAKMQHTVLSDADLRQTRMWGVQAPHVVLTGAKLQGAVLNSISPAPNLADAKMQTANLSGANISEADLQRANLTGAILSGTIMRYVNLKGATLTGANLEGAVLEGAVNLPRQLLRRSVQTPQSGRTRRETTAQRARHQDRDLSPSHIHRGGEGTRTLGLRLAKPPLFHLSYTPVLPKRPETEPAGNQDCGSHGHVRSLPEPRGIVARATVSRPRHHNGRRGTARGTRWQSHPPHLPRTGSGCGRRRGRGVHPARQPTRFSDVSIRREARLRSHQSAHRVGSCPDDEHPPTTGTRVCGRAYHRRR